MSHGVCYIIDSCLHYLLTDSCHTELRTDISGNVVDVDHRHADAARVHRGGVEMVVLLPGRGRGRRRPTHLEDMFPPICLVDQNVLRYSCEEPFPRLNPW